MVVAARRARMVGGLFVALCVVPLAASLAAAEQVEIVTYYPSPAATTDDLRVKRRVTVGPTYRDLKLDDSLAPIGDGTLLVETGLGLGTTTPFATAPDTHLPSNGKPGNLDVNDIWIRNAQAWASTLGSGALVPPYTTYVVAAPYTWYSGIGSGETVQTINGVIIAHDVYEALGLARFGVARNQVRLVAWQPYERFGSQPMNKTQLFGVNGYGQTRPVSYNVNPPSIWNGIIFVDTTISGNSGPAPIYEVTVTW